MYTILTNKHCVYCEIFKQSLDELGVDYLEKESRGTVPKLIKDGKIVFVGLPDYKQLIEEVKS